MSKSRSVHQASACFSEPPNRSTSVRSGVKERGVYGSAFLKSTSRRSKFQQQFQARSSSSSNYRPGAGKTPLKAFAPSREARYLVALWSRVNRFFSNLRTRVLKTSRFPQNQRKKRMTGAGERRQTHPGKPEKASQYEENVMANQAKYELIQLFS